MIVESGVEHLVSKNLRRDAEAKGHKSAPESRKHAIRDCGEHRGHCAKRIRRKHIEHGIDVADRRMDYGTDVADRRMDCGLHRRL